MPILNIVLGTAGADNIVPRVVFVYTNDTIAEIAATGYLNKAVALGNEFTDTDMALVTTKTSQSASTTEVGWYEVSKSGTDTSLIEPSSSSSIVGNFSATGTISAGTNLIAGSSGTAGTVSSFPGTASKGSLVLAGVDNTGDTLVTISNAAHGQASAYSIPDVGASTGQLAVVTGALTSGNVMVASGTAGKLADGAFAVQAETTAAYGGGGTSNAYTATGLGATSIVTAVILASTNAVAIQKAVPTANVLTITFSADPGASTTVSWVAITPAV